MGTILGWPSVAQVGDSTVIAAADTDGSLVFYWQPIGSQQWNPEQVAGPGVAFSPPSVAQVGDSTVIAARGPDDSLLFYWQPIGSQQWNPEQVAGPGTTFEWPTVAQVGNSTVIAAQGPDGSLVFYWQPIGSQQWNPEQVAGPESVINWPSVAQVGNSTVIAALGPDSSLLFYWQPIGSQQWNPEQVAGPGTTFDAPSVAQVGNSTVIAAQGPGGSLLQYWQPIGSGQWNPEQVTGTGSGASFVVSEAQFNQMFPNRNPFYTYGDLVAAMAAYPAFATTGGQTVQQQEAAAFLANVSHETAGLVYVVEQDTANYPDYCDPSQPYGCPAGNAAYYGRGPLQLSWNFNYKAAGDALGVDLLDNPDLVATNAAVSWKTALWYWMTQNGPNTMTAHDAMVNGAGFGQTIRSINGTLECDGGNPAEMQDRVNLYTQFTQILGVAPGANLTC